MKEENLDPSGSGDAPNWQSKIVKGTPERCATADNSTVIDSSFREGEQRRWLLAVDGSCFAQAPHVCCALSRLFLLHFAHLCFVLCMSTAADAELRKVWELLEQKYKMPAKQA
jgi:hypothetical protein